MKSSRRHFLQSAVGAPLAAGLGGLCGPGRPVFAAPLAAQDQDQFENPHIIRYDSSCFTLQGRDTFIFSAAFHYPRCPRELWRDRLLKFKQAGFNTIETYVFWNYHEREEGRADLSEFEDFIKLVKSMGFFMIARPGPYVCAEWDVGGFPHWVVAKRFPLRTNHPESIRTSQHWLDLVLPVIQRNQITVGGSIIMVQVENEYDFSPPMPDVDKRAYVRALARMAWNAGINVPIITCWTKPARENTDADMALIMDTCNFYPRWNIVKDVVPALAKLRREEPATPVGVTELQGGWFSEFGGKLSIDQEGMTGAQLNQLTKTVIEQGVTYFNYYMGFGGTNFDWAAKNMTTTYDYAAPIREPGGLGEKYYAARGIGCFLNLFGTVLTRAQALEGAAESTNPNVSVSERASAKSAVVFVRENANAEQHFKMTFVDQASPTKRRIAAPREGDLVLGPREMKMLPVGVPVPGGMLRYTTAEVLAHGLIIDRQYLVLYDVPGRVVELALSTADEPQVQGDTVYQYWDQEYECVVMGVRVEKTERILVLNNHLLIVVVPRGRGLQTWTAEFPAKVIPDVEETKPMVVPFITDTYLLADSGSQGKRLWVDLDFLPGLHDLTVLLPPQPQKCFVNGALADFQYERPVRATRLQVTAPDLPVQGFDLREVRTWVEKFDPNSGQWLSSPPRALEDLGPIPYGYVKYRAQFPYNGEPKMFISTSAEDGKKVFLNGKLVPEAANAKTQVEFALAKYAQSGPNTLEISYELFGSPNFGEKLGELKGIESVRYGADAKAAAAVDSWQIQRFPAAMRGKEIDPEFSVGGWQSSSIGGATSTKELLPAFTWCRAEFTPPKMSAGWTIPLKLTCEADRDALLYLNGKFLGRYVTVGPQKDFFLPEPYLVTTGKKDVLTIVLAYTDQPGYIRTLRISPYEEYATHRTRVEFAW